MLNFIETEPLKSTVDLCFSSTYPVYLKLWSWTLNNTKGFVDLFPEFKQWSRNNFEDIFINKIVNEAFGSEVIRFVQKIYLHNSVLKETTIEVSPTDNPMTAFNDRFSFGNLRFYFVSCSSNIILCNVENKNLTNPSASVFDYIATRNPIEAAQDEDSYVKQEQGLWFINTNRPFMAYPNGISNDKKSLSKKKNIPFYSDFFYSFFCNTVYDSNQWYSGCKTVRSYEDEQYLWEFITGHDMDLVIITNFRKVSIFDM